MLRFDVLPAVGAERAAQPDSSIVRRGVVSNDLASSLVEYQRAHGAPEESVRAAGRLADPDAVVVVTGQQPGLLGGPLFTLAKALSAVAWARRIERESGRTAVPVFWVASEDHDLIEVNRADILDGLDRLHSKRLDLEPSAHMLSEVDPGPGAAALLAEVESLLPDSEFRPSVMATLADGPRSSIGAWFAGILCRWLGRTGLVVVEPHLFRGAAAPLVELAHSRPGAIRDACAGGPIEVAPVPFFRIEDGRRIRPAALDDLPTDPESVSFDVVTRVLAQNLVLPVAGHVVGPSEMEYCRQVAPAHALLGVSPPPLLPRARLLLVEGKVERALTKFGVDARAVAEAGEDALKVKDDNPEEFDSALTDLEDALQRALADLGEEAGRIDEVLLKKTSGAEKEMMRAIDRLRDHGRRAMDRVTGRDREQREKILSHLRPGGGAQERVLSPLTFLARHGLDLAVRLLEVVTERPDGDFAIYLKAKRG